MKKIRPYNASIMARSLALGELTRVNLPRRAQVLGVRVDIGGTLWLTAAVFKDGEKWEMREFVAITETTPIPHERGALSYIGAAQSDAGSVAHVFEIDSPEEGARVSATRGASVVNQQSGPVNGPNFQIGSVGGDLVDHARRHFGGVQIQ